MPTEHACSPSPCPRCSHAAAPASTCRYSRSQAHPRAATLLTSPPPPPPPHSLSPSPGAFPTTLLYGLVPPLAALSLRRACRRAGTAAAAPAAAAPSTLARSARLLPGGTLLIGLLVAVAGGFILTSAALAAASLLPGVTGLLSLL